MQISGRGEKVKAVIVNKAFEIEIKEVEMPKITKKDDVLIKVISGGICGSDIGIYNGTNSLVTYPRKIGHEFGGTVIEVGSGVLNINIGDKVAVDPVISCGNCYACSVGRHNVCENLEAMGVHREGGFAEYVVVSNKNVNVVNDAISDEDLICLVEPYSIGAQVNSRGRISNGDKLLIMGSGPIGLTIMQFAKANGATVIMTDIIDEKLIRAKEMGADEVVNVTKCNLKDAVADFVGNNSGIPIVIDSVCTTNTFSEAIDLASAAGRVVVLGLIDTPSQIAQVGITKKELDIVGSRLNNNRFPEVIEAFRNNLVTPEKLYSHKFNFKDIEKALEVYKTEPEKVCKVIITFED